MGPVTQQNLFAKWVWRGYFCLALSDKTEAWESHYLHWEDDHASIFLIKLLHLTAKRQSMLKILNRTHDGCNVNIYDCLAGRRGIIVSLCMKRVHGKWECGTNLYLII